MFKFLNRNIQARLLNHYGITVASSKGFLHSLNNMDHLTTFTITLVMKNFPIFQYFLKWERRNDNSAFQKRNILNPFESLKNHHIYYVILL